MNCAQNRWDCRTTKKPLLGENLKSALRKFVRSLPRGERSVIELNFWEGLSTLEIAKRARRQWEVIYLRKQSALKKLREHCIGSGVFDEHPTVVAQTRATQRR